MIKCSWRILRNWAETSTKSWLLTIVLIHTCFRKLMRSRALVGSKTHLIKSFRSLAKCLSISPHHSRIRMCAKYWGRWWRRRDDSIVIGRLNLNSLVKAVILSHQSRRKELRNNLHRTISLCPQILDLHRLPRHNPKLKTWTSLAVLGNRPCNPNNRNGLTSHPPRKYQRNQFNSLEVQMAFQWTRKTKTQLTKQRR